jgi:hypothetical protein
VKLALFDAVNQPALILVSFSEKMTMYDGAESILARIYAQARRPGA